MKFERGFSSRSEKYHKQAGKEKKLRHHACRPLSTPFISGLRTCAPRPRASDKRSERANGGRAKGRRDMQCLSLGSYDTAVVRASDGALFTCGSNTFGQLGLGDAKDRGVLTRVEGPLLGKRVVGVSAGPYHTAAITADGEMFTWGRGTSGELGHGDEEETRLVPKQVQSMRGKRVVAVSCGKVHTAAVTDDGELYVCGDGLFTPSRVQGILRGERVVAVSAGWRHTAVLTAAGGVYTFREGDYGQLGHSDTDDRAVPTLVDGALQGKIAVGISVGVVNTAVVMQGGELYTFGDAGLATDHGTTRDQCVPTLVAALRGKQVVSVSSGVQHTVGVTADGQCYTWGDGANGRLGHGDDVTRRIPKLVNALVGKRVVAVAAGDFHTAALTLEGTLFT